MLTKEFAMDDYPDMDQWTSESQLYFRGSRFDQRPQSTIVVIGKENVSLARMEVIRNDLDRLLNTRDGLRGTHFTLTTYQGFQP